MHVSVYKFPLTMNYTHEEHVSQSNTIALYQGAQLTAL